MIAVAEAMATAGERLLAAIGREGRWDWPRMRDASREERELRDAIAEFRRRVALPGSGPAA